MQQKQKRLGTMRLCVQSLALLSGLRIWHCHEMCCRSQMWLVSGIAVAVVQASSYSSNQTPSLGTSICRGSGLRNGKKTKNKNKKIFKKMSCLIIKESFVYIHTFTGYKSSIRYMYCKYFLPYCGLMVSLIFLTVSFKEKKFSFGKSNFFFLFLEFVLFLCSKKSEVI